MVGRIHVAVVQGPTLEVFTNFASFEVTVKL
jgi:hypothetical protein